MLFMMTYYHSDSRGLRAYFLRIALIAIPLIFFQACLPPEPVSQDIILSLEDPVQVKIMDFQDRQQLDSIYPYFRAEAPVYRYLAARAMAAIRLPESLDSLVVLLQDPHTEVAAMAAYAIGQTGNPAAVTHLTQAFRQNDPAGENGALNRAILEATGKCGDESALELLSTIKTYRQEDTLLLEGQALGIYRMALRSLTSDQGTQTMLQLATESGTPPRVRLIAAHYLSRASTIELKAEDVSLLAASLNHTSDIATKMALVSGLGKTKAVQALDSLRKLYRETKDYRIKVNILVALNNFEYEQGRDIALEAVKDPHWAVRERATDYLFARGTTADAPLYRQLARDSLPSMTSIALYKTALRHLPDTAATARNYLSYEMRRLFEERDNPYEKAALLVGLAQHPWNYRSIAALGFPAAHPAVRVAAVEALRSISQSDKFIRYFGNGTTVRRNFLQYFTVAIQSKDPGMMAVAAQALSYPDRNYAELNPDLTRFTQALDSLQLPRETETWYELKRALAFLRGESSPAPLPKPAFNHPIDWSLLEGNDRENPIVTLMTNRGVIRLELYPLLAPGSVANFLALIKDGFYDGKNFHRTVPNFVVQGGCPRGDGYGSLDYTIRSELPPIYYHEEGMLGMASAGNHTEGTQFFITHSPTPHLDGQYTIFGRVIAGMERLHDIAIGDTLQKITLESRFNQ